MTSAKKLEILSLRFCNINDEGFSHLCDGLANVGTTLKYLDVAGNKIGREGIEKLVECME